MEKIKNYCLLCYLIIVAIFLVSCSNIPTKSANLKDKYIVKTIESFGNGLCVYKLSTGTDYINFNDNLSIVDSIGKFSIDDSIYIEINKYPQIGDTVKIIKN